jgi:hypothetical protein
VANRPARFLWGEAAQDQPLGLRLRLQLDLDLDLVPLLLLLLLLLQRRQLGLEPPDPQLVGGAETP